MSRSFSICLVPRDDLRHATRPGLGTPRAVCGAGVSVRMMPGSFDPDSWTSCPDCADYVLPFVPRQRQGV